MSVGVTVLPAPGREAALALGPRLRSGDRRDPSPHEDRRAERHRARAGPRRRRRARGATLAADAVYGREGIVGQRQPSEIGILALRGGDVVGDHTVIFAGIGERLELTHRAQSRDCLARGAIRAALWLAQQPVGRYGMSDVLGWR